MKSKAIWLVLGLAGLLLVGSLALSQSGDANATTDRDAEANAASEDLATAYFAAGCFWCVEADFEKTAGVTDVLSGYMGGDVEDPTYEQVSAHTTGHREAVEVHYDPEQISYQELLGIFWRMHDPTDAGGSFVDRGESYTSAIFYGNDEQRRLAEGSKAALASSGKFDEPIATEIAPADPFYLAEDYHQNYYETRPLRYRFYRSRSGRNDFIDRVWDGDDTVYQQDDQSGAESSDASAYAKPSDEVLRRTLTPMQYDVTQQDATERAFDNAYWDNHEAGIYVDVVSGEPVFSSLDKYDSGTGWPSFTKPMEPANIVERADRRLIFMVRTDVRSKHGDSHLGHVFEDGPAPTGLRYCLNSAALRFVPVDRLEAEGYGEYLDLFESTTAQLSAS